MTDTKLVEYRNLTVGSYVIDTFFQDEKGVTYVRVKELPIGMKFDYDNSSYRFTGLRGYRIDDYGGSSLRGYATRTQDKSEWTFHRDTLVEIVPYTYVKSVKENVV